MKKSQGFQFNYLLILVILVSVIFAVRFFVKKTTETAREREFGNFIISITNGISRIGKLSSGSAEDIVLSVPVGIDEACFVDKNSEYHEFNRNELNSYVSLYQTDNFFLRDGNRYLGYRIPDFELKENPLCLKAIDGKISMVIVSQQGIAKITAPLGEMNIDCSAVLLNGLPDDKIDIVFLPYGYKDTNKFKRDIADSVQEYRTNEIKYKQVQFLQH